jgi:hypothetical protein
MVSNETDIARLISEDCLGTCQLTGTSGGRCDFEPHTGTYAPHSRVRNRILFPSCPLDRLLKFQDPQDRLSEIREQVIHTVLDFV